MCAFSGNRLLGAYRSGDELGFLWNEPQGGPYPYPYVATARIRASDAHLIAPSRGRSRRARSDHALRMRGH